MNNVILNYKKNYLQYSTLTLTLEVVIDSKAPIKIAPGNKIEIKLDPGIHEIRSSIPYQGNDRGLATAKIDVQSNSKYEIVFKFTASMFGKCNIIINTIL